MRWQRRRSNGDGNRTDLSGIVFDLDDYADHRGVQGRDGEVLAETMSLDAFRRTQLADAVAAWGQLPETTVAMCITEREANLERRRLVEGGRELIDRLRA